MIWILPLVALFTLSLCKPPVITKLTMENYNDTVNSTLNTFVLYHDESKDSHRYMKEFIKACKLLAGLEDPLNFATFDVLKEKDLRKNLSITRFPMAILFLGDKNQTYEGQRYGDKLAYWVEKMFTKSKPNYLIISSYIHKVEFEKKKEAMVVYFGDQKDKEFEIFETISKKLNYLNFGVCKNKKLFKEFQVPVTEIPVMLVYHEKEGRIFFYGQHGSSWDLKEATHFIETYSVPNMFNFNVSHLQAYKTSHESVMVLLYSSADEKHEELKKIFNRARYLIGGEMIQGLLDLEGEDGLHLMTSLKEKMEDMPSIWIFNHSSTPMKKHKFEGNETAKDIYVFFRLFQEGRLPTLWRSEAPPEKNDEIVKKVVGATFDDIVLNNTTDVILFLTDPDCRQCKKPFQTFTDLAVKYESYENLVFASMNAYFNEVEELKVESIPKILFYSRNNKVPSEINSLVGKKIEDFLRNNVWELRKVDKEL